MDINIFLIQILSHIFFLKFSAIVEMPVAYLGQQLKKSLVHQQCSLAIGQQASVNRKTAKMWKIKLIFHYLQFSTPPPKKNVKFKITFYDLRFYPHLFHQK